MVNRHYTSCFDLRRILNSGKTNIDISNVHNDLERGERGREREREEGREKGEEGRERGEEGREKGEEGWNERTELNYKTQLHTFLDSE